MDKKILEETYQKFQKELYLYLYSLCQNRQLTEEKLKNLYDGIRKLENRKQEVLQLQYFAHLSQKEIAAVLHLTPEHVRILAYRARKELKALMDKEYQEERK